MGFDSRLLDWSSWTGNTDVQPNYTREQYSLVCSWCADAAAQDIHDTASYVERAKRADLLAMGHVLEPTASFFLYTLLSFFLLSHSAEYPMEVRIWKM